ncbi:helix-turn-helix domain-containing protein [Robiginitalea biformata]|uniref:Transcriptional regulator, AraC family protein n=2 Tax=Flavobacteriaceae TaxID=49546 RepID=A4CG58_ROBBH|nr:helix-turn-helix domain-containing protein [Robiginitalea biformata]EAR15916.1 transcriptional regulator, AraC family protein [Robiginitalea biformata HTCC2501]
MKSESVIANTSSVRIVPISGRKNLGPEEGYYAVCWIQDEIPSLRIGEYLEESVGNSLFFLSDSTHWCLDPGAGNTNPGYVLYIPYRLMNDPRMSRLHMNEVRLLAGNEIPRVNPAPGIARRIQDLLEMLDELAGSHLNHRDEAILSLLNTFFIYLDGQCNVRSVAAERNSKKNIVLRFKKLIYQRFETCHEVRDYADLLNISDKYLNECVNEVLGVNAKSLIDEQRIMRSRHLLKFSDKAIKEISYELGFSSPDYFGFFLKKHTGMTPTMIRRS